MSIPDFLKRENRRQNDPDTDAMLELIEKYRKAFGDYPTTEPSVYSTTEWIGILKECIETKRTVFEVLDGELETEENCDYNPVIF